MREWKTVYGVPGNDESAGAAYLSDVSRVVFRAQNRAGFRYLSYVLLPHKMAKKAFDVVVIVNNIINC